MLSFLASVYLFVGFIRLVLSLIGWWSLKKEGELGVDDTGTFFFIEMTLYNLLIAPAELLLEVINKIRNGHKG